LYHYLMCLLQIVAAVQAGADAAGASSMRMISRGYHDSGLMAQIAPVGMVFIPCRCNP
jgi:ureidoglycolate amidohydrolase